MLSKDIRIRSGPPGNLSESHSGRYSYPDIFVLCGKPQYMDKNEGVILNPKVIIEVLSLSTEGFDRGDKCTRYQTWNESRSDYLLVSQTAPLIEHFTRKKDGSWNLRRHSGLEASFVIQSIRCTLPLADVYDRVGFADEQ